MENLPAQDDEPVRLGYDNGPVVEDHSQQNIVPRNTTCHSTRSTTTKQAVTKASTRELAIIVDCLQDSLSICGPPIMLCQSSYRNYSPIIDYLQAYLHWNSNNASENCFMVLRISCTDYCFKAASPKTAILNRLEVLLSGVQPTTPIDGFLNHYNTDDLENSVVHHIQTQLETYGKDSKLILIIEDLHCLFKDTVSFTVEDKAMEQFLTKHFIDMDNRCVLCTTNVPIDLGLSNGILSKAIQTPLCCNMPSIHAMLTTLPRRLKSFTRLCVALCGGNTSLIRYIYCKGYSGYFDYDYHDYLTREDMPLFNMYLMRSMVNAILTGELTFPRIGENRKEKWSSYEDSHIPKIFRANANIVYLPTTITTSSETVANTVILSSYRYRWSIRNMGKILHQIQSYCEMQVKDSITCCLTPIMTIRMTAKPYLLSLFDHPGTRQLGKDFDYMIMIGFSLWLTAMVMNADRCSDDPLSSEEVTCRKETFPLLDIAQCSYLHPIDAFSFQLPISYDQFLDSSRDIDYIKDSELDVNEICHFQNMNDVEFMHSYLAHLDEKVEEYVIYGIFCSLNPLTEEELQVQAEKVRQFPEIKRIYNIAARTTCPDSTTWNNTIIVNVGSKDIDRLLGFSLQPLRELYQEDDPKDIYDNEERFNKTYL